MENVISAQEAHKLAAEHETDSDIFWKAIKVCADSILKHAEYGYFSCIVSFPFSSKIELNEKIRERMISYLEYEGYFVKFITNTDLCINWELTQRR